MREVIIKAEDINNEDSQVLIDELSDILRKVTGSDGRYSFDNNDMLNKRSVFAVVRDEEGNALGCGALRYYAEGTAEIKRMYVKEKHLGIGTKLLSFLEDKASELKYKKIILETRVVNNEAVKFYRRNDYIRMKNYGKYVGMNEAICFYKDIK